MHRDDLTARFACAAHAAGGSVMRSPFAIGHDLGAIIRVAFTDN